MLSGAAWKSGSNSNQQLKQSGSKSAAPHAGTASIAFLATSASITRTFLQPPTITHCAFTKKKKTKKNPHINYSEKVSGFLPVNAAANLQSHRVCLFKVWCCVARRQVQLHYSGFQSGKQNKAQLSYCTVHAADSRALHNALATPAGHTAFNRQSSKSLITRCSRGHTGQEQICSNIPSSPLHSGTFHSDVKSCRI